MLRRQSLSFGQLSFLDGGGEMAMRIRDFDWASHPFGPIYDWPPSLRSALGICLHSAFPTAIYWGGDLRLLYNDAWAPIPGPRHPAALGAMAKEVWSDIWHEIEPQFRQLIETGQGLFFQDKMLPMARYGVPEETYWSYSFTPIRDESGAIVGIFNSGSETTALVLSNRQKNFLLEVREAMSGALDVGEVNELTARAVLEHTGAAGAVLLELCEAGEGSILAQAWAGSTPTDDATRTVIGGLSAALAAGRPVRIDDEAIGETEPGLRADMRSAGLSSAFAVVRRSPDRDVALALLDRRPRVWNGFEHTTLESTLDRLIGRCDQLLLQERERLITREIDHRARNALAVAQSIVRQTLREGGPNVATDVDARLMALSKTQALLAKEQWQAVSLAALIREELAPFDGRAITTDGPSLSLKPQVAQSLALIIHELTTNSVKYGALGSGGTLSISWSGSPDLRCLDWREQFGPDVARGAAPAPTGRFGSKMIDRLIGLQLRGEITRGVTEQGFCCHMTFRPSHDKG